MQNIFRFSSGPIILSLLILLTSTAFTTDHWEKIDEMLHPRLDHTATLLQNDKVLIAGGDFPDAELYDPVDRTFQITGALPSYGLRGATATLLQNGKVLFAGGMGSQQTATLYDPQTGNFNPTDSLGVPHSFHTATLLPDGRVLIAGGQDQNGLQTHAVCEIYDPQSETFSLTDSLDVDRSSHTATLLSNGHVLIAGGFQTSTPGNGIYITSCEISDPVSGVFSLAQNLISPRTGHDATLLADGSVLISGGAWNNRYCERYNSTTNSWIQTGDMTVERRSYHTATLLHNGKVLLAGGYTDDVASSAELYDPATNSFTAVDSMFTPREQHTATILSDGNVLVTGGYSTNGPVNLAEIFIVDDATSVNVGNQTHIRRDVPESFHLLQNYPNPFNPITTITFKIKVSSFVELYIINLNGQKVRKLICRSCDSGVHSIDWNGLDNDGKLLTSGIYLCILESEGYRDVKKLIMQK